MVKMQTKILNFTVRTAVLLTVILCVLLGSFSVSNLP